MLICKVFILLFCLKFGGISGEAMNTTMFDHTPPRFVEQPPSGEVLFKVPAPDEEFRPFYLHCEAEGEPHPKYRWIKNNSPYDWESQSPRITQQPGLGTLIFNEPRAEDAGQYQCFAENEFGTATSNAVSVRKAEFQRFKSMKTKVLDAQEGKPFMIPCDPPYGYPKLNIFWMKTDQHGGLKTINDSRITVDPLGNLWFSNVTLLDASTDFEYTCAATAVFSNEYKIGNKVILNVADFGYRYSEYHFPVVRQYVSPSSVVALVGESVELFCIYGGSPQPRIEWTKNGNPIVYTDRVLDTKFGKSLLIRNLALNDTGSYICSVSNGAGKKDSHTISLEIQSKPYFVKPMERKVLAEGETFEIECSAKGNPLPETVWIFNGKPLDLSEKNPRKLLTNKRIIIKEIDKLDMGNYGCNASNNHGYVYQETSLIVQSMAPYLLSIMKNQIVTKGSNVTIACPITGAPKPNIQWQFENYPLSHQNFSINDNFDLQIYGFSHSDAGNYSCIATNKYGSYVATAEILVTSTKIVEGPERQDVKMGEWVSFRCSAVSLEGHKLKIYWLKNNNPINFEENDKMVQAVDGSMTVFRTVPSDSGVYTCLAKSEIDEARATALLRVFKGGCHADDEN